ncbi:helix-turn-helix domain-containing protein [Natrinema sp. 74]|uniref:helix-turn-helix domain-containing protein n=1 Tax=Natrinema sp. 74 TaxID=3384159 RepID=UPI0038D4B829
MSTSQFPDERRVAVPTDLASPQAKLVYLSLLVSEGATATDLRQSLGLSKLTLFAVLESLIDADHVRRTEDGYVVE